MTSFMAVIVEDLFDYFPFIKEAIIVIMLFPVVIFPPLFLLSYVLNFIFDNYQGDISNLSLLFILMASSSMQLHI
jgi:hypothetical protein